MKKILSILILSSILYANEFVTVGFGKSTLEYYSAQTDYLTEDKAAEVLLEYGYDDMEFYRAYIDMSANSQTQGIAAMLEWAPRFSFIPSYIKKAVGIPSISTGFGFGYNHLEIEGNSILTPSFNLNLAIMLENGPFIFKIGNKSRSYNSTSVDNHDFSASSDTQYFIVQYSW